MRLALALAALVVAAVPAGAQDAGTRYVTAYRMVGFRLRATYVCPNSGSKAAVERAFAPISAPELRAFSKAFPETTKKWMGEGAGIFNDELMQNGINVACQRAR